MLWNPLSFHSDRYRYNISVACRTSNAMSSLPPPPVSVGTTPTRRRQAESSNVELLSSIADNSGSSSDDDSKIRRQMHFKVGPLVISGAAIDRVRARFVSL